MAIHENTRINVLSRNGFMKIAAMSMIEKLIIPDNTFVYFCDSSALGMSDYIKIKHTKKKRMIVIGDDKVWRVLHGVCSGAPYFIDIKMPCDELTCCMRQTLALMDSQGDPRTEHLWHLLNYKEQFVLMLFSLEMTISEAHALTCWSIKDLSRYKRSAMVKLGVVNDWELFTKVQLILSDRRLLFRGNPRLAGLLRQYGLH
ncbi:hypothetical protein PCO82_14825 [Pectobacteriaceae bacterium CE90]|nr:hypothetical protein [Prodigiosinella sp. LS101]WJV55286.1 hypothetical protein PCO85_07750 [Prodigiosinella sp. LS101]WJV59647.1 hypothetical protein PCO84_07755 [Pectobacteriaceae bacterium C111]WJY13819.1 hypothetical protein PCO82_14825 [Pectobacteriaceae bacterium CE90]